MTAVTAAPARAARLLRLDVQGVGSTRVPVALSPFDGPLPEGAEPLHEIIASDMQRSGMLQVAAGDTPPDASLHGSVQALADG
ncbi:MAG: hypothetical protein KF683_18430, partial [Rubrivivax sp.]|nr:hypothetical protein [Rubrivivax sp.]